MAGSGYQRAPCRDRACGDLVGIAPFAHLGMPILPMGRTGRRTDPDIAENSAQAPSFDMTRPPGTRVNQRSSGLVKDRTGAWVLETRCRPMMIEPGIDSSAERVGLAKEDFRHQFERAHHPVKTSREKPADTINRLLRRHTGNSTTEVSKWRTKKAKRKAGSINCPPDRRRDPRPSRAHEISGKVATGRSQNPNGSADRESTA